MDTESYTVVDPNEVREALQMESSPQGLIVSQINDNDSCSVKPIPPGRHTKEIRVSKKLIQELFEQNSIKRKKDTL